MLFYRSASRRAGSCWGVFCRRGKGVTWLVVVNLFRNAVNQCQEIVNLSSTTSDNLIRKRHRAGGVSPTRWCAGCTVSPHCAPAGRLVWCYWKGVSPTRTGGDKLLVVSIRVMKTLHWHPLFLSSRVEDMLSRKHHTKQSAVWWQPTTNTSRVSETRHLAKKNYHPKSGKDKRQPPIIKKIFAMRIIL